MNNKGMFYTNVDDYETKEDMMNDFIALRMYDMEKDKEIEKLVNELEEQERHIKEANYEIERLNNIINELEKWLEECKDLCVNYSFDDTYECEYNYYQQIAIADFIKSFILVKLKELKGDSSNE